MSEQYRNLLQRWTVVFHRLNLDGEPTDSQLRKIATMWHNYHMNLNLPNGRSLHWKELRELVRAAYPD